MASTAVRTCGTAVIRMTAMDSLRARMRGSTAGPDSPGIRTSSSATSIRRDRTISRAAAPSAASSTSKSSCRMMRRDSRTPGSSSITRTTGRDGYVNAGAPGFPGAPPSAFRLGYGEDDILVPASAALQIYRNGISRLGGGDDALEVLDIGDGLAVDLEDRVPRPDPCRLARAPGGHVGHEHAGLGCELEALRAFRREGLDLEPEHFL